MKNFILLVSLFFFICSYSQEQIKDTLFFKYDKNYMFFYADNKKYKDYKELESVLIKNMNITKTEGYFTLNEIDTLYNLNPKKIYSLKEYVEKRKFYYDGSYGRVINSNILRREIFNKYNVFIVHGNNFIKIRQHPYEDFYSSYYPIRYHKNEKYPKQKKDTLFIKYNNGLLKKYKHPIDNYNYYLIKDSGTCGTISFEEKQVYLDLKAKNVYCLKEIIKKAKAYHTKNKYKTGKIDDCNLANYLGKYTLFFVDENKFIKVQTWIEEE